MEETQGIDCLGRHMSINAERLVSEVACVHIPRWERPSHWTRELEFSRLCGEWCLHLDIRRVCLCQANTCGSHFIVVPCERHNNSRDSTLFWVIVTIVSWSVGWVRIVYKIISTRIQGLLHQETNQKMSRFRNSEESVPEVAVS